jgi:hypothetical protein
MFSGALTFMATAASLITIFKIHTYDFNPLKFIKHAADFAVNTIKLFMAVMGMFNLVNNLVVTRNFLSNFIKNFFIKPTLNFF